MLELLKNKVLTLGKSFHALDEESDYKRKSQRLWNTFLDEEFTKQYEEHQRFGKTILYATLLTLFIALLGLFGLTAFTVERRTREIGIRKVLGASVAGIIGLLAKDFMKLVALASLIAIPIGLF